MTLHNALSPLDRFRHTLDGDDLIENLRAGLIGKDVVLDGPFGPRPMLYADYVASGRALRPVEEFVLTEVLPYYANSHTEASFCGAQMTTMRRAARRQILKICGGTADHAAIFTGSGATAGLNRLVHLLGLQRAVRNGDQPLVLIGPYEHHSNILPWRESGAEVIEIREADGGGVDTAHLTDELTRAAGRRLVIGAFSAASNVTGLLTDVAGITRILKAAGALAVWDYAGGGPYLPIQMTPAPDAPIDAIVTSPHKFLGGPGASGVMILRRDAVQEARPTTPGGGTVRFVNAKGHDFARDVETREESGTPNVVGDIRAALAFIVKDAIGQTFMDQRNTQMRARARAAWAQIPGLELLGPDTDDALPIFSMRFPQPDGSHLHHQLATRILSDCYGVQARGGCSCAGPYVLRLLGLDGEASEILRDKILCGDEMSKPGFLRLNLSVLMSDDDVTQILDAITDLVRKGPQLAAQYHCDASRAIFSYRPEAG